MHTETRPSSSFRAAGLAATASTLVALVAMSATVASGPAPREAEESRLEGHVVRAVAAAVAAAARDLLVSECPAAAVAVLELCVVTDGTGIDRPVASRDALPARDRLLGERLLDLPPPSC